MLLWAAAQAGMWVPGLCLPLAGSFRQAVKGIGVISALSLRLPNSLRLSLLLFMGHLVNDGS